MGQDVVTKTYQGKSYRVKSKRRGPPPFEYDEAIENPEQARDREEYRAETLAKLKTAASCGDLLAEMITDALVASKYEDANFKDRSDAANKMGPPLKTLAALRGEGTDQRITEVEQRLEQLIIINNELTLQNDKLKHRIEKLRAGTPDLSDIEHAQAEPLEGG